MQMRIEGDTELPFRHVEAPENFPQHGQLTTLSYYLSGVVCIVDSRSIGSSTYYFIIYEHILLAGGTKQAEDPAERRGSRGQQQPTAAAAAGTCSSSRCLYLIISTSIPYMYGREYSARSSSAGEAKHTEVRNLEI